MKRYLIFLLLSGTILSLKSQVILDLDSCRALAIANNKELLISNEKITSAYYEKKAAYTNYLPKISATGAYLRTFEDKSLLSKSQENALNNLGTTANYSIQQFAQEASAQFPDIAPLFSSLGNSVAEPLNGLGNSITDALRFDTRNIYVGAVSLTQPIYMGGKIRAYNKITKYAEELAHEQHDSELQEVILNIDQAYWQVVSLVNKKRLAESYLNVLNKLDSDMDKMIAEGVATKADGLSVKVKVNEAEITLTKVDNGLSLAKMLLCQLCGLDLNTPVVLKDEQIQDIPVLNTNTYFNMESVYANRPEIRSLELGREIYKQKINVTRAEHLPTIALTSTYLTTNPGLKHGIESRFRGNFSVGVLVQVPLWTWGEGTYKVRSAKAEARIAEYQLEDAKEKIELQVNQSVYQVNEAMKKVYMTNKNMEKAEENLRYANLGFKEGVIPTSNVLEAQTAWLSAQSEKIDAQIDAKLSEVYLQKSLGTLDVNYKYAD